MANPVIDFYKGIPIRKYNTIRMRIDTTTLKKIIDLEETTNLSQRQIICYSSKPCTCCKDSFVTVATEGGEVHIPRGILSKKIPIDGSGAAKKRKING